MAEEFRETPCIIIVKHKIPLSLSKNGYLHSFLEAEGISLWVGTG